MTRRAKRPVPDWMMPDPPRPVAMSDEDIADLVEARRVSHAICTTLGYHRYCPRHKCRRAQACRSFDLHADYRANGFAIMPACIRSHAALDRYHEAEITILNWAQAAFEQDPENNSDKDYSRAFYAACARFRAENGKDEAAADQASSRAATISAIAAGRPRK